MSAADQNPELQTVGTIRLFDPGLAQTLSEADTFSPASDLARQSRGQVYQGIPRALTLVEVHSLGMQVALTVLSPGQDSERVTSLPDANKVQVRALRWLGERSLAGGDTDTNKSVITVLSRYNGVRGKVAAAALWYERFIQV